MLDTGPRFDMTEHQRVCIKAAIAEYKKELGQLPPTTTDPNAIDEHLSLVESTKSCRQVFADRLQKLDEREILPFWLGEAGTQLLPTDKKIFFEFLPQYLSDIDGDGWMEYSTQHNSFFYFEDGQVVVKTQQGRLR